MVLHLNCKRYRLCLCCCNRRKVKNDPQKVAVETSTPSELEISPPTNAIYIGGHNASLQNIPIEVHLRYKNNQYSDITSNTIYTNREEGEIYENQSNYSSFSEGTQNSTPEYDDVEYEPVYGFMPPSNNGQNSLTATIRKTKLVVVKEVSNKNPAEQNHNDIEDVYSTVNKINIQDNETGGSEDDLEIYYAIAGELDIISDDEDNSKDKTEEINVEYEEGNNRMEEAPDKDKVNEEEPKHSLFRRVKSRVDDFWNIKSDEKELEIEKPFEDNQAIDNPDEIRKLHKEKTDQEEEEPRTQREVFFKKQNQIQKSIQNTEMLSNNKHVVKAKTLGVKELIHTFERGSAKNKTTMYSAIEDEKLHKLKEECLKVLNSIQQIENIKQSTFQDCDDAEEDIQIAPGLMYYLNKRF